MERAYASPSTTSHPKSFNNNGPKLSKDATLAFGLPPTHGKPETKSFKLSSGARMSAFDVSDAPAGAPGGSKSLFDQYKPATGNRGGLMNKKGNGTRAGTDINYEPSLQRVGQTRSSLLRSGGVRLNCYLNAEGVGVVVVGGPRGHGTLVQLPTTCDTIEEALPLIQLKMKLNERMMYAADLWLPDGTSITTFQQLVDASAIDTPIIVGCGEPFDGSRVPLDLLEFHRQGGGRGAVHKVNKTLKNSRKNDRVDKAESVRQAGHGLLPNSLAVVTARSQNVETNREKAANMRQYYMESLVRRTADQEDLKFCAQQNIKFHRMEKEESRLRYEEKMAERMERLKAERRNDVLDVKASKREDAERAKALHDKVKAGAANHKLKKKAHSERYRAEARKADFGTRPGQVQEEAITETY